MKRGLQQLWVILFPCFFHAEEWKWQDTYVNSSVNKMDSRSMIARGEKEVWASPAPGIEPPWLTGPLIAPASQVVTLGHINVEPYVSATANTGVYSSDWKVIDLPTFWNNYLQITTHIGFASWLEFVINPTVNWNYSQHQAAWALGDMPFGFGIQLYRSQVGSWIPWIKLALQENLPIGKYQNLNPKKLRTDDGGIGSWVTEIGIIFGNLYHFNKVYYIAYRLFLNYQLPAPVHLKGFNFYGGGFGTDARFFPSQNFLFDLAFEVTLAQNWAFALDIAGIWGGKSHFSGSSGTGFNGQPAQLGNHSQAQFSLAPAIEYNWSLNLGIIAGSWFTVLGRNAPVYTGAVIALNYYK